MLSHAELSHADIAPPEPAATLGTSGSHQQRFDGRDIICFSNDWSGDPLSKTHLMRLLAQKNRVLWINSIGYRSPKASKADISRAFKKVSAAVTPVKEVEPNLFVMNPLAVPVYGRPFFQRLNRQLLILQVKRVMRKLGFRDVINWVFMPSAGMVVGHLGESSIIYHCVDEFSEFTGVDKAGLSQLEEQLIRRSDLVIVSADRLYQSKSRFNPNTRLVRHGVDFDHFRKACDGTATVAPEIADLPRPVLGFFGLVADWVDVELMAEMAKRFNGGSLVVVGKLSTDISPLERLPNVHFLGRKPYADLPKYCAGWDVALMPFRINELTLNSNPLKVREYLAAGLPVVSTPIPEVEVLNLCRIASTPDEFEKEIRAALTEPMSRTERSDSIRHESWQARLDEIESHLFGTEDMHALSGDVR